MKFRELIDHLKSRKQTEVVIGVLMGLRGCSSDEAAQDFIDAVRETGVSPGELGRALIGLASGQQPPSHKAEALQRWRHLLALRGRAGDQNEGAGNTTVRVPYGPENESTIC